MIFLDQLLSGLKKRSDTDFIDRLNYYYTPMLMVFFGLTLSAKQYVGTPIQCWVPAQFTGAWEQYSEFFCFVQNTYFVPFHEGVPELNDREHREIGYYQWVPFILALQAFLFFFPLMLWRLLNWQSGIAVKTLVNASMDIENVQKDACEKNTKMVARHIQDSLNIQRDLKSRGNLFGFCFYGKHYGCYVTGLYLFIKFLFILNVVTQFFILNAFIGSHYTFWGLDILRDILNGREWEESGHFPRVTMCDFKVRVLGNLHNWSIQCVLQINMFNEKIYLFLWWWFLVVAFLTILNFFYWITVTISKQMRRDYVLSYLNVYVDLETQEHLDRRAVDSFVDHDLRPDGVFLLRMISSNAGHIVATQLVGALWNLVHTKPTRNSSARIPDSPPSGKETPPDEVDPGFEEGFYDPSAKRSPENKALLLPADSV